jgi:hypothetical protein
MGMERRGAASLRCVRGEWRGSGAGGNGGGRGGDDTRVCMARIVWADERSGGVCGVVGGARRGAAERAVHRAWHGCGGQRRWRERRGCVLSAARGGVSRVGGGGAGDKGRVAVGWWRARARGCGAVWAVGDEGAARRRTDICATRGARGVGEGSFCSVMVGQAGGRRAVTLARRGALGWRADRRCARRRRLVGMMWSARCARLQECAATRRVRERRMRLARYDWRGQSVARHGGVAWAATVSVCVWRRSGGGARGGAVA